MLTVHRDFNAQVILDVIGVLVRKADTYGTTKRNVIP
jgi:hypothetical protein